ncbi:MAG: aquaporin [Chlamydiota bacterium]
MRYITEFIGTFFLVLTVGMTVLEPHSAGLFAPLAIGLVLAVMIYAGAHISGGHYNPAVSLAVFLRKKLSLKDLMLYWGVQFLAAIVAAYVTTYLKGQPLTAPLHLDTTKALLAEFLFTFALCYVVLNLTTLKATKDNCFYGLAIGFTVVVGAYAVGAISGAAFNPAVALSIALINFISWSSIWVFFVASIAAALAAHFLVKKEKA